MQERILCRLSFWRYALLMLTCIAAAAGSVAADPYYHVHTITDANGSYTFGQSVAGIGDINADGVKDCAVGDPSWQPDSSNPRKGRVKIFSGVDRSLLYTVNGPSKEQRFGWAITGMGDLNADTVPDMLVGGPGVSDKSPGCPPASWLPYGIATALSGANPTGAALFTITGNANSSLGFAVADIGDVVGTSLHDFVVTAPDYNKGASNCNISSGSTFVYEGHASSPTLRNTTGLGAGFGALAVNIGDVNGDSIADYAIPTGVASGNTDVTIYSGTDRSVLSTITLSSAPTPSTIVGLGDITGSNGTPDGKPDIAIGGLATGSTAGNVWIYRGDGSGGFTLAHTLTGSSGDYFGVAIVSLADIDADGTRDFAVVAAGGSASQNYVRLYSGYNRTVIEDYFKAYDLTETNPPGIIGAANLGDLDSDGVDDFAVGNLATNKVLFFISGTAEACSTDLPLLLDNATVTTSVTNTRDLEIRAGDLDGVGSGYTVTAGTGASIQLKSETYVSLEPGFTASASSTGSFSAEYDANAC